MSTGSEELVVESLLVVFLTDKLLSLLDQLNSEVVWNKADCLVLCRGKQDDDSDIDTKSAILHRWIFGYELPDSVLLIRKDGIIWFLGTKKKVEFLSPAIENIPSKSPIKEIHLLTRNKDDNNAKNFETLWEQTGLVDAAKRVIGIFMKEHERNKNGGACVGPFEARLSEASEQVTLVDIAAGLSFCMSVKDDMELDLMRKSSVLSNKIMKHGFITKMESVIDQEEAITRKYGVSICLAL